TSSAASSHFRRVGKKTIAGKRSKPRSAEISFGGEISGNCEFIRGNYNVSVVNSRRGSYNLLELHSISEIEKTMTSIERREFLGIAAGACAALAAGGLSVNAESTPLDFDLEETTVVDLQSAMQKVSRSS